MDLGLKLLGTRFGCVLSGLVGRAAAVRWPRPLLTQAIRIYSKFYGLRLEEAGEYGTFLEFFTRELRPGLRSIDPSAYALISPVDGRMSAAGPVDPEALVQAKGITYRMDRLVGDASWVGAFAGGTYLNLYLNPADYHRFHAPTDMQVIEALHVPGALLPVNEWSRSQVQGLYAGNERIVVRAEHRGRELLMVFVAATSVGRVRLVFDDLTTHNGARSTERRRYDPPHAIRRGQELGRFELGSTVILFFPPGWCRLAEIRVGERVTLGQRIGSLSGEDQA
jgi:phosphatidylserine decarboxylase